MIVLRDVLVRPGIIDSERLCALPLACQLFFRNLLHACDGAGRFSADADELKAAFYWRASGVSRPHVEAWLAKCHQANLVKLYTRDGKPYGELLNYGQRDTKRRHLYPPPDDGELNFSVGSPPGPAAKPSPRKTEEKRSEGKGTRREAPATPAPESQQDWIARLRAQWPAVDVVAELLNAERERRRDGRALERLWFEQSWLPNVSPVVSTAELTNPTRRVATIGEPDGWKVWLKDHPDQSWADSILGACGGDWDRVPANIQRTILRGIEAAA